VQTVLARDDTVTSAVGEGAIAVQRIHQYLADTAAG
jgi:hypothetical protein